VRWTFAGLESGRDIPIVATGSERDRFVRHCSRQRIRCGPVRDEATGIVGEHPAIDRRVADLGRRARQPDRELLEEGRVGNEGLDPGERREPVERVASLRRALPPELLEPVGA
jgi:hypothetical protein